jgi:Domain of unknown function (DUF4304)
MLPLEAAIAPQLKAAGFRKRARTWWRQVGETIHVVNLQKSPFGERLYVNLGVYLAALGTESCPPHNRCHVQVRLERIADATRVTEISSAEATAAPSSALVEAVVLDGLGWLDGMSTKAGVRRYLDSGGSAKGLVFATVRQFVCIAE